MYSEKVLEYFRNPRNVGLIEDADGVGTVGNPVCGDLMTMYIKVENDRIVDIKFQTFGCGAAIATSSMATELAKGKTLEEALKITKQTVAEALGGLPPQKMHCSNLAADALKRAIADYLKKAGRLEDLKRLGLDNLPDEDEHDDHGELCPM
ncbi:Fe-S cluster assembly scaffold protein NifU [Geoglobus sp.]